MWNAGNWRWCSELIVSNFNLPLWPSGAWSEFHKSTGWGHVLGIFLLTSNVTVG